MASRFRTLFDRKSSKWLSVVSVHVISADSLRFHMAALVNFFLNTTTPVRLNPDGHKRKTSRDVSSEVKNKIEEYRRTAPGIFSWEVKEKLVADGMCTKESLPPLTVISRLLRRARSTGSVCDMEVDDTKENAIKAFTPFSIDNILKAEGKLERPESVHRTETAVIDLGEQQNHPNSSQRVIRLFLLR